MYRLIFFLFSSILLTCSNLIAQPVGIIKKDISYISGGNHKQQLDLFTPHQEGFPTILFIHGGSLTSGDRKDEPHEKICLTFNQAGIGCSAMSYPLVPDHKWPTQPKHAVAAFDWIKKNIGQYGGDPDRIFIFGHSSGCLLTSIIGSDPKYLAAQGYIQKDVAGLIPLGCRLNETLEKRTTPPINYEMYAIRDVSGMEEKWLESQNTYASFEDKNDAVPANHVDHNLPPTLILMGDKERFFPPVLRDASEFVGRALSKGAKDIDIKILENRTHISALERMVSSEDPGIKAIIEFIKTH